MSIRRSVVLTLAMAMLATANPKSRATQIPLEFEQNQGQADKSVLFLVRGSSGTAYLTRSTVVFQSGSAEFRMSLAGSNSAAIARGEGSLESVSNYLLGSDSRKWVRGVPHWARVRYATVYRGIDLLFRGGQQAPEYDLVVAPGADPSVIRLQFDGTPRVDANGDLLISNSRGELRQHRPVVYQDIDGKRRLVAGEFRIPAGAQQGEVRFAIGAYDRKHTLVIDPVLTYGAAVTGSGSAFAGSLAVDSSGSAYLGGSLQSLDFPTANPLRTPNGATGLFRSRDAAATFSAVATPPPGQIQLLTPDPRNASVVYAATSSGAFKSTDGGQSWTELSGLAPAQYFAIAIDPANSSVVYVGGPSGLNKSTDAGATWKSLINFDVLSIAIDPRNSSTIWFVPSFGPAVRSTDGGQTFFGVGNSSQNYCIAVDPSNSSRVYVGRSGVGLVTTTNGVNFADRTTAFAPGGGPVNVRALLIDPSNPQNVFFATDNGLYRSSDAGGSVAPVGGAVAGLKIFSLAFDSQSSATIYAGTSGQGVFKSADGGTTWKAVGPGNQDVNALASTSSSVLAALSANQDAFVTKFDPTGTKLVYSTYIGGTGADRISSLAADTNGRAFACGATDSPDFPVRNALQPKIGGARDAFVLQLNATGSDFVFSTYLGGFGDDFCATVTTDSGGSIYLAGDSFVPGSANNFPQSVGAFRSTNRGGQDCFVTKLSPNGASVTYSLLLGGSSIDICNSIAIDSGGNAYVSGNTYSTNLPTAPFTGPRLTGVIPDGNAKLGFVAKFAPDGQMIYSQLLGGNRAAVVGNSRDTSTVGIAVNTSGQAYVAGTTTAGDFPTTPNVVGSTNKGIKGFVAKVDVDGTSLLYSTFLPGNAADNAFAIALDPNGNVWIAGVAFGSSNVFFPTTADAADARNRSQAGLLLELDKNATSLLYASFTGGADTASAVAAYSLALGTNGSVFVSGVSASTDLAKPPTTFGPSGAKPAPDASRAAGANPDYVLYVQRFDSPAPSTPVISAIVDGASFAAGPVAPGALVVIGGQNLTAGASGTFNTAALPNSLSGTSVRVNGFAAPLYYASPTQINLQLPAGVQPGTASVVVTSGGLSSTPAALTVAAAAPHIFIFGDNRAGVRNQDTSINTAANPALPSSVITVYFTGIGPVDNPVTDGQPAPVSPLAKSTSVTARIGSQDVAVQFAGLTPQAIGLAQANLSVPNLPPGDYPVTITVGGAQSNSPLITIGGASAADRR